MQATNRPTELTAATAAEDVGAVASAVSSAPDLADATLLQVIGWAMVREPDPGVVYEKLVDAAINVLDADFASLQELRAGADGADELALLASRNVPDESKRAWETVRADCGTTCSLALRNGARFSTFDIREDPAISAPHTAGYLRAGIVSAQSTPLITSRGKVVGMLSTYWREPHSACEQRLRMFDRLAILAADALDRYQTDARLKDREAWLSGQKEAMQAALDGASLFASLGILIRTLTAQLGEGMRAAFYLVDREGGTLEHVVGMGEDYAQAVNGFRVGPESLSSGSTAATSVPVLTTDVLEDARWLPWIGLAEKFGYRGCWSFPIHSVGGNFVGTVALYWPRPRTPLQHHIDLVSRLGQTAALIISHTHEAMFRRAAEELGAAYQARLTALIDSVPVAIGVTDAEGRLILNNQAMQRFLPSGRIPSRDPAIRSRWRAVRITGESIGEDDYPGARALRGERVVPGQEMIYTNEDEVDIWTSVATVPIRNAEGQVEGVVTSISDIDVLKRSEQAALESEDLQRILITELQHRTRNLLGMVQQIANKTARNSRDQAEFLDKFNDRLQSLSRVQGILGRLGDDERVTFDHLLREEFDAIGCADRVELDGPADIRLRTSTLQTLALALHELATNAVKHGALSMAEGRLRVHWRVDSQHGEPPMLHVVWEESGLHLVRPPVERRGQGIELIERALPYQLNARTSFDLRPEGLLCTITLPISVRQLS